MPPVEYDELEQQSEEEMKVEDNATETSPENSGEEIPNEGEQSLQAEDASSEGESGGEDEGIGDSDPEEPKKGARDFMIPKSRYDRTKQRLNAAMDRIKELEKVRQTSSDSDGEKDQTAELESQLIEIDTQYAQAIADGKHEEAAALMQQARKIDRQIYQAQLKQAASHTTTATREQIKYDTLLGQLEGDHPVINPDAEEYDEDLVGELSDLVDAFEGKGIPASQALQRAASYVLGQQAAVQNESPAASARKTDVKKNLETAHKQPASMTKAGADNPSGGAGKGIDVMKMSDAEFEKLGEGELSRLRGDELVS